jgi:predicted TIM-barrel fold metal-dependent hydrolase
VTGAAANVLAHRLVVVGLELDQLAVRGERFGRHPAAQLVGGALGEQQRQLLGRRAVALPVLHRRVEHLHRRGLVVELVVQPHQRRHLRQVQRSRGALLVS